MSFWKKSTHPSHPKINQPTKKGFTLVESLLSLLVFAIIMHSLSMAVTHYYRIEEQFRTDQSLEFHLFTKILSLELENYQFITATNQMISLTDVNKPLKIIHSNHKIYKTPGHQPYLYDVQSWFLEWTDPILIVTVTFTNQQVYSAQLIID